MDTNPYVTEDGQPNMDSQSTRNFGNIPRSSYNGYGNGYGIPNAQQHISPHHRPGIQQGIPQGDQRWNPYYNDPRYYNINQHHPQSLPPPSYTFQHQPLPSSSPSIMDISESTSSTSHSSNDQDMEDKLVDLILNNERVKAAILEITRVELAASTSVGHAPQPNPMTTFVVVKPVGEEPYEWKLPENECKEIKAMLNKSTMMKAIFEKLHPIKELRRMTLTGFSRKNDGTTKLPLRTLDIVTASLMKYLWKYRDKYLRNPIKYSRHFDDFCKHVRALVTNNLQWYKDFCDIEGERVTPPWLQSSAPPKTPEQADDGANYRNRPPKRKREAKKTYESELLTDPQGHLESDQGTTSSDSDEETQETINHRSPSKSSATSSMEDFIYTPHSNHRNHAQKSIQKSAAKTYKHHSETVNVPSEYGGISKAKSVSKQPRRQQQPRTSAAQYPQTQESRPAQTRIQNQQRPCDAQKHNDDDQEIQRNDQTSPSKSSGQNDAKHLQPSSKHHEDHEASSDSIHFTDPELESEFHPQQGTSQMPAPTGQNESALQHEHTEFPDKVVHAFGQTTNDTGSPSQQNQLISTGAARKKQTSRQILPPNHNFNTLQQPLASKCPLQNPRGSTSDVQHLSLPTPVSPAVHRNPPAFQQQQSKDLSQPKILHEVHRDPRASLQQKTKQSGESPRLNLSTKGRKNPPKNAPQPFVPPRRIQTRRSAAASSL